MARLYKIFTWLSLDITAGAIVFMTFLSREFGTPIQWSESAALGISVWLIYTIDHLLDVRAASSLVSERRKFHKRYFNTLVMVCGLLVCIGIWIISLLQREMVIYGAVIALIAGGYLVLARFRRWTSFKEVQIAIGYAIGVSLIPFLHIEVLEASYWLVVALLFLTALTNLILFSWYEVEEDRKEGFGSIVFFLGDKGVTIFLWLLFGLCTGGVLGIVILGASNALAIFFLLSTSINLLIWRLPKIFKQKNSYRAIGDGVFLLPLIWLIW